MDRGINTGFSGRKGIRKRPCKGPKAATRFARLWNRRDAGLLAHERRHLGGAEAGRVGRHQVRPGLEMWILTQVLFKARGGL